MRRWHAVPVAVLTALTVGMVLFGTATPVNAGGGPAFRLSVDCDSTSTADVSIQSNCTPPSGTTTATVSIVFTNNSGSDNSIGALAFQLTTDANFASTAAPTLNPSLEGGGTDFNCELLPATQNPETLNCFLGIGSGPGPTVANGASVVLSRFTYNIAGGDVGTPLDLEFGTIGNNATETLIDQCLDTATSANACFDAAISVGGGAVNTPTNTAVPATATNTNTPGPTATPCEPNCPTGTPRNFVTVVFTPTPGTPTPGTGETPPPPPPPPPPGEQPGGGQQPGGQTGAGGGRPIRLPDTGAGDDGSVDWSMASLFALLAVAAGSVAGGAWLVVARRNARTDR
jgi:hypothetical protein